MDRLRKKDRALSSPERRLFNTSKKNEIINLKENAIKNQMTIQKPEDNIKWPFWKQKNTRIKQSPNATSGLPSIMTREQINYRHGMNIFYTTYKRTVKMEGNYVNKLNGHKE